MCGCHQTWPSSEHFVGTTKMQPMWGNTDALDTAIAERNKAFASDSGVSCLLPELKKLGHDNC